MPFSTFSHSHSNQFHTNTFTLKAITQHNALYILNIINIVNAFDVNELESKYILHAPHSTTLHTQHTQRTHIQYNILNINRPTLALPSLGMRGFWFAPSWPRTAPWLRNYFHTVAVFSLFSILLTASTATAQRPSNKATVSSSFTPMPTLDPHISVSNLTVIPSIWRDCTHNQRPLRLSLITHGKKYFDRSRNTHTSTYSQTRTNEDTPHEALMVSM